MHEHHEYEQCDRNRSPAGRPAVIMESQSRHAGGLMMVTKRECRARSSAAAIGDQGEESIFEARGRTGQPAKLLQRAMHNQPAAGDDADAIPSARNLECAWS
jgi:hypothetical protein